MESIIFFTVSLPNRPILYVVTAGVQLIKCVLFDNTVNDNGPCGAPNYIRTVSSPGTVVASGNNRLCNI